MPCALRLEPLRYALCPMRNGQLTEEASPFLVVKEYFQ
jgi:hypothetical protein